MEQNRKHSIKTKWFSGLVGIKNINSMRTARPRARIISTGGTHRL